MEERSLRVLEFAKIRERLAAFTSFNVGRERALALLPIDDIRLVREWQAETREAQRLLEEKSDVHLGGVHDLRPQLEQAVRGRILVPTDLLDVRSTLQRARSLQRTLSRVADNFPHVADVAARIAVPQHVIDEITRCIDERGEVLDSASEALERASPSTARVAQPPAGTYAAHRHCFRQPTLSAGTDRDAAPGALRDPSAGGVQGAYSRSCPRPIRQRCDPVHRAAGRRRPEQPVA